MSDIVLTAAVRQNLLSLQGTADLLATTQTRLATGKKVNSALDNPTNYFTAAGLDARAGDISNLLDSIGNGVQVLQAANTGITSLQKLVDTAKSIANQALQQPTGYSTKSNIHFIGTGTGGPRGQVWRLPPTSRPARSTAVFTRSPIPRASLRQSRSARLPQPSIPRPRRRPSKPSTSSTQRWLRRASTCRLRSQQPIT